MPRKALRSPEALAAAARRRRRLEAWLPWLVIGGMFLIWEAAVRIFAKTDVFMAELLTQLGLTHIDTSFDARSEWKEIAELDAKHGRARIRAMNEGKP